MVEINNININMNSQAAQKDYSQSVERKAPEVEKVKEINTRDNPKVKHDPRDLKGAVDVANKMLFKNNTHLKFEIHDKTKEVMVKIINDESGEVVKEIPPEKMLDMAAKLWEIAGILVDERR